MKMSGLHLPHPNLSHLHWPHVGGAHPSSPEDHERRVQALHDLASILALMLVLAALAALVVLSIQWHLANPAPHATYNFPI